MLQYDDSKGKELQVWPPLLDFEQNIELSTQLETWYLYIQNQGEKVIFS